MMRSLYSAVSGLKNHQTKMDVIGNNISNVNTVAFKSSSVTFSDIIYQTVSNASGATGTSGGINAKQIGLGVSTASTAVSISTAGAAQTTGNPFDIKLTDKGNATNFFVVSNGSDTLFTRAGSFYIDGAGNLCMSSTGYTVMGWQVDDATGDIKKDTVSALRIMQTKNLTSDPEATTQAYISGIVDKNSTDLNSDAGYTMALNFYDNLGYSYTAKFTMRAADADDGRFTTELSSILDSNGNNILANYNGSLSDIFGYPSRPEISLTAADANLKADWSVATSATTAEVDGVTYNLYQKTGDSTVYATAADGTAKNTVYKYSEGALVTQTAVSYEDMFKLNKGWSLLADGTFSNNGTIYSLDANGNIYEGTNNDPATGTKVTDITLGDIFTDYNSTATNVAYNATTHSLAATYINYNVVFDTSDGSFKGVGQTTDSTNPTVTMNLSLLGSSFDNITVDFSGLTNKDNSKTSTAAADRGASDKTTGAGKKLGSLTGISVETTGKIYGSYDNGNTILLGQIAVAQFANASGLEKVGESCYRTTLNSGEFDGIGVAIDGDGSSMTTGELEMSNVDLSSEFTEMITTQRGFQANSRVITTSDSLLEELINLKR